MNRQLGLEHNKKNVGKLIRAYRQNAHFKSEYVARELCISASNYSKLENGQIDLTDARLTMLCKIYEITPPEFYFHFKYS